VREQDSTLRSLSLKDFAVVVFQNCPELRTYLVSTATWSRQLIVCCCALGTPWPSAWLCDVNLMLLLIVQRLLRSAAAVLWMF
jgi:hypothetical protein